MMCDAARPLAIATLALVCVGSMPPAQAQDQNESRLALVNPPGTRTDPYPIQCDMV